MQGLDTLKKLAEKLPAATKANALKLIGKMGETIEGIGDKPIEWRPSNLKVVQATTDRSTLPKGTAIGSIVIGEEIQDQPMKVIPLRIWTTRQKWSSDRDNNKLECWSPDGEIGFTLARDCKTCPHQKFDTATNRAECNKSKTAMAITADMKTIFNVNFSKTNYQNGMHFEDLMKKAGVSPYKRVYALKTETHPKYKNVEALIPEADMTTTLDGPTIEFLQELYSVMSADRTASLSLIYELVKNKRTEGVSTALPAPVGDDDGVIPLPSTANAATGAGEDDGSGAPRYAL